MNKIGRVLKNTCSKLNEVSLWYSNNKQGHPT